MNATLPAKPESWTRNNNQTATKEPAAKKQTLPPVVSPSVADGQKTKHIIAKVNVGWGNAVYLRGEGGGLNWDIGIPMSCVGEDRWMWSYPVDQEPHAFKFLRNDRDWSVGENCSANGREVCVYHPQFAE